jgi:hypothetical protein
MCNALKKNHHQWAFKLNSTLAPARTWDLKGRTLKVINELLKKLKIMFHCINPLNAELNSICHLPALLGTHPILHISRIRVKHTQSEEIQ